MATYGLRACEVVTLTIDDVEWRAGRLRIPQRKTRGSLWLPLTDEVGTALLDYLRHGRDALNVRRQRVPFRGSPPRTFRELFLRCRTPRGVLKPTAVTEAFQAWSKRSGLAIPFQGPHCVRHSYAVHLLRSGLSLKTIATSWAIAPWRVRACISAWWLMTSVTSRCPCRPRLTAVRRGWRHDDGLSATIGSYLTLKRALGRQYAAEEWVLAHLDRFLAARRDRGSRVMPVEGRGFRWKRWRKVEGSREWLTPITPMNEQQYRTSSHAQAKGTTTAVAVVRASTGLTTHRSASVRVRVWCRGSRNPPARRNREARVRAA